MTRKEYLAKSGSADAAKTHREYYAQFVNERVRELVKDHIGFVTIKESTDPALNDIPLGRWDSVAHFNLWKPDVTDKMRELGDYPTMGSAVCILKEAAKQLRGDA